MRRYKNGTCVYLKPFNSILNNGMGSMRAQRYIDNFNNNQTVTINASSSELFNSRDFDNGDYNYSLSTIDNNRKTRQIPQNITFTF